MASSSGSAQQAPSKPRDGPSRVRAQPEPAPAPAANQLPPAHTLSDHILLPETPPGIVPAPTWPQSPKANAPRARRRLPRAMPSRHSATAPGRLCPGDTSSHEGWAVGKTELWLPEAPPCVQVCPSVGAGTARPAFLPHGRLRSADSDTPAPTSGGPLQAARGHRGCRRAEGSRAPGPWTTCPPQALP